MRVGTRLLIPLISMLLVVMILVGVWLLRASERRLLAESSTETRAYATALAISLEHAGERAADVDKIIQRVSAEPSIYGLLVYDGQGRIVAAAAPVDPRSGLPAATARNLIARNTVTVSQRSINNERFLSVVRPFRLESGGRAALEVVQPLSNMQAQLAQTRARFIWSGMLILAVVTLITIWMGRQIISRPLQNFLRGTRALGRGELSYRIPAMRSGAEIEELRTEFNTMADHLVAARELAAHESEERVTLERQLRHTEKLAAVGNLAASLAHEIAAPLNVVAGRAQMLRRGEQHVEQQKRNLEIITDQIARITLIVRNLLDYARAQPARIRPTPLAPVIEAVVEFVESELARAQVRVNVSVADLVVDADANLLHQVFLNLILNSIQALDAVAGERAITIVAQRDADQAVIQLLDTGSGMSEEVAAQAFEAFFTTKRQRGGTGLGLAVARNIIEEHGGTITAQPGAGGRFVMTLRISKNHG